MWARSNDHSRGQATVEFVLLLPLVGVLCGCIVAVTAVCLHLLSLNDLARNCARTAAVSLTPADTAADCAREGGGTHAVTHIRSGIVTVSVHRTFGVRIPVLRRWHIGLPLAGEASMALEPPERSADASVSVVP